MERLCEIKILHYTKDAQQTACSRVSLSGGDLPSRQKDLLD